jgi:Tfp pilus assembly PilM family ATPase
LTERFLGISFSSSQIQYTELSRDDGAVKLENAETSEVDFDFDADLSKFKSNQKALTNISSEIQKYVIKRSSQYSGVSAAVGTSQAFLITLPIDYSEGKQALNSKIYWELSNYFPDNYNDYIVNTYRMNSVTPAEGTDDFLIIAVPGSTVEFIKRIFKLCSLSLSVVDIDHFSAEHALRRNYDEDLAGKNVLLIGVKKGRVDFGFIADRKFCYYTYSKYYSAPEFNLSIARKFNSLTESRLSRIEIDHVLLYGDEIKHDTLELLKKNTNAKVELMNPFESVSSSSLFLKNEELRKVAYRYSPSCGVALRSLESVR